MAMKEKLVKSADSVELTEALVLTRTRAQDLESVKKLNCWASKIGDVNVVRRLPNLEVCSLSINKITTLRDFAHCYKLQELYVRTNSIGNLSDIHYLKNLRKLRSLWLSENPCANTDNYRATVLRALPHLQKLDNVAVTEEEVARAEKEGDDLPVPEDFSYSSVFDDVLTSSEGGKDTRCSSSVSESSERWALPRLKRQQRKREAQRRERRSCGDEDSGSCKSGDDVRGSGARSSDDGSGRKGRASSISPRGDDTEKDGSDDVNSPRGEDTNNDGSDDVEQEDEESHDVTKKALGQSSTNSAAGDSPVASTGDGQWAVHAMDRDGFKSSSVPNDGGDSENSASNITEDEGQENNTNKELANSPKKIKDGDINSNNLCAKTPGELKNLFPKPEKSENLSISQSCSVNEDEELSESDVHSAKNYSNYKSLTIASISEKNSEDDSQSITVLTVCDNENYNVNSHDDSCVSIDSANPTVNVNSPHGKSESSETPKKSEKSLLDKIRLDDSLDVQESTEDESTTKTMDTLDQALADFSEEASFQTTATEGEEKKKSEPVIQSLNWEEHNRRREELGVKPINWKPGVEKSAGTELAKVRNSNLLQAVLCLVKELDKDSLEIVASAVKGRLDSM